MISYEIPNEIRQGANVALTEAFARGENPYRMMTNGNGEPMVFYMYPFLHSLIGAGIVKLTSLPATLVLLGLNFLYITATAVLISRITYCYTKEPYTVILAFLLSHYCGWRYTYVSAFPDMLAVMLMILIIYLCTVRKERINNKYLPVLSILTVLCFYSKQYAIVIGLPVAIWLWLYKGKKQSMYYIGWTALFGIVSAGIIYMCMPLYFVETLLLVGNSADNSVWWSITQFIKIGKLFFPWFFVILIWFWRDRRKKREVDFVWIHFFSMMILLIYFGQNQGAHLSYHLQLGLPAIIILAMRALNWLLNCERIKGGWLRNGIRLIALVCAIYPAWWLKTPELTKDDLANWNHLYDIAENSTALLATPQNTDEELLNGRYVYDCGQNQYILRKEALQYWDMMEESALVRKIFPEALELKKVHEQYREQILNGLEAQRYDTLLLVENFGFTRDWDDFTENRDQYYIMKEQIPIETGSWRWTVGVWERKERVEGN